MEQKTTDNGTTEVVKTTAVASREEVMNHYKPEEIHYTFQKMPTSATYQKAITSTTVTAEDHVRTVAHSLGWIYFVNLMNSDNERIGKEKNNNDLREKPRHLTSAAMMYAQENCADQMAAAMSSGTLDSFLTKLYPKILGEDRTYLNIAKGI